MSESIGFNITPDSGTSLRKVLKYELDSHLDTLDAISAAASKVRRVHVHSTHVHYIYIVIYCMLSVYIIMVIGWYMYFLLHFVILLSFL